MLSFLNNHKALPPAEFDAMLSQALKAMRPPAPKAEPKPEPEPEPKPEKAKAKPKPKSDVS
jgi:colicin import membrane protein